MASPGRIQAIALLVAALTVTSFSQHVLAEEEQAVTTEWSIKAGLVINPVYRELVYVWTWEDEETYGVVVGVPKFNQSLGELNEVTINVEQDPHYIYEWRISWEDVSGQIIYGAWAVENKIELASPDIGFSASDFDEDSFNPYPAPIDGSDIGGVVPILSESRTYTSDLARFAGDGTLYFNVDQTLSASGGADNMGTAEISGSIRKGVFEGTVSVTYTYTPDESE